MKLSTREDVAAPIDAVFRAVSDFDGFERAALRRGAEVARTDTLSAPGVGMTWAAQFPYRNRERKADLRLANYDPPHGLELFSKVSGIEAVVAIDLVALSRTRTRMNLSIDLRPKTIPARLMIQSMKLAKSNLTKRFQKRVAGFAQDIEDRYTA
ncbi:SRPBCC family protein [Aliiroseovarius subalbicans]|uniref:SRPBCC family protein n=1 Tax=Aliiroseovarius subalbicans TaxID=2925840 RepID=UPI001F5AD27A|nr:SRPBCC family protein [Aliiroseovarius subalbicans]MCI2399424.1 SRPBCC family protein [Aliiroseovarius subalbicans]